MVKNQVTVQIDGKTAVIDADLGEARIMDAEGKLLTVARVQVAAGSAQGEFSEVFED